ncbi:hypothetical protein ACQ4PT_069341 [Festuca glaucescens]
MAAMRTGIAVVAAAFLAIATVSHAQAPAPSATPSGPQNVTAILDKGGQYTTFIRLLKTTQQDTQLNSQLNNSFNGNGYTLFAPTDNAFNNLKAGTLNSLTQQQQVSLVQGHILPQFYTMESFQTASNPIRTQASGTDGPFTLNVTTTASNNQMNVSTGVVVVSVNNALSVAKPLAVYTVDKVLLPQELFRAKAPAAAPTASKGDKAKKGEAAAGPAGSDDDVTPAGAAGARAVGWGVAAIAALVGYLL